MSAPAHVPVLAQQVADWLVTDTAGVYWDATVGAAGHARVIVERLTEGGKLFGSDRDPESLRLASAALTAAPVTLMRARFSELSEIWRRQKMSKIQGILFDFGVASHHLDRAHRGFSFDSDGPLDMRMDPKGPTVSDWLSRAPERDIARVLHEFGEERGARRIARAIVRARPVKRTAQLREIVLRASGPRAGVRNLARVFQALRIQVNQELDEIRSGLAATRELLGEGGRIVTLAYHSLEDRIVKEFFRRESRDCVCPPERPVCSCEHQAWLRILTRRPERPGPDEVSANPRARSARLRVAERCAGSGGSG